MDARYSVRTPTEADLELIADLMYRFDQEWAAEPERFDVADLRGDWDELTLGSDAWVVVEPDGELVGYGTITDEPKTGRIVGDGYVHPEHGGRGMGTELIERMEARAAGIVREDPIDDTLRVLVNQVVANDAAALALLDARDYRLTRVYFQMHINLTSSQLEPARPEPAWPAGVTVRACDGSPEDTFRAYDCIEDAFRSHWGRTGRSFEEWQKRMVREDLDVGMWLLAEHEGRVVGAALSRLREADRGWLDQIGVCADWRKRGLGIALLHASFAACQARGATTVGLGVDGQSLTGAQRLYERAGMSVTMRVGRYEKTMREGRDIVPEVVL